MIDHDAHSNTGGRLADVQIKMNSRAATKIGRAKGTTGAPRGRTR
ncbi:hypothetical protein ACFQ60_12300 [Streptomyces zhihengii]